MTLRLGHWFYRIYQSPGAAISLAAVVGLIATLNHTLWRDEMNVWLIVRDSPSFAALVENIHYDRAHPGLWHLMVATVQSLFGHPLAMQILHWLLAVSAIALLWRYSPFAQWQKWLITFGYLPFYENLLITRNYAVAMLLLFALCALWPARRRAYWPLAGLLVLMANSNIYALWIAIALTLTLAVELGFDPKLRRNGWDVALSGLLVIVGCAVALYFILPPSDAANEALEESFFYFDWGRLVRTIGRFFAGYYLFIPNVRRVLDLSIGVAIAIGSLGLVVLHLVKKPYALAFYLFGNGIILSFTYVKFMPSFIRHFGHFYLVLIAALWLAHHYPVSTVFTRHLPKLETWAVRTQPWFRRMVATVLLFHLVGGLYKFSVDLAIPNSAGRAAAAYMRANGLQDEFIVGSRDAEMAPLSGYLGRSFYYPERQAMGSYTLFFKGEREEVSQPVVLQQVADLLPKQPRILLVLTAELAVPTPGLRVEPIASFPRSQHETYHLYWVEAA